MRFAQHHHAGLPSRWPGSAAPAPTGEHAGRLPGRRGHEPADGLGEITAASTRWWRRHRSRGTSTPSRPYGPRPSTRRRRPRTRRSGPDDFGSSDRRVPVCVRDSRFCIVAGIGLVGGDDQPRHRVCPIPQPGEPGVGGLQNRQDPITGTGRARCARHARCSRPTAAPRRAVNFTRACPPAGLAAAGQGTPRDGRRRQRGRLRNRTCGRHAKRSTPPSSGSLGDERDR